MAMEAIGSVMTLQAQSASAPRPVVSAEKAEQEPLATVQAADPVDQTTSVVENAQAKGQSDNNADKEQDQTNNEKIRKAVEKLNKQMNNSEAVFGIHEKTNRVTIKIINKDTKEVIKELPPEKTLDMISRVWEMAGILIDEKR